MNCSHDVHPPLKMDRGLLELFARFNLENFSQRIAWELGIEVPNDFIDVEEKELLELSETLGLKPVPRNRLLKLYQSVLQECDIRRGKMVDNPRLPVRYDPFRVSGDQVLQLIELI